METKIEILNLKCGGCANTIKKGLYTLEGVVNVDVDLENSFISVTAGDEQTIHAVKEKLSNMGYPEANVENTLCSRQSRL